MEYFKCAFTGAIIGKQYGCQCGVEITRREGPSIGCTCEQMYTKCARLVDQLKVVSLPQFGYEDDLTQMPHSVLMKIQLGGLGGMQKHLAAAETMQPVINIEQLVNQAEQHYGGIEAIPVNEFVKEIVDYKLRRRR